MDPIECELFRYHEPYGIELEIMQNIGLVGKGGINHLNPIKISRKAQLTQLFINSYIIDWGVSVSVKGLKVTWHDDLITVQALDLTIYEDLISELGATDYLQSHEWGL